MRKGRLLDWIIVLKGWVWHLFVWLHVPAKPKEIVIVGRASTRVDAALRVLLVLCNQCVGSLWVEEQRDLFPHGQGALERKGDGMWASCSGSHLDLG